MSGNRRTTLKRAIANLCFPLVTVGFIAAVYATAAAIVGESLILPRLGEILAEAGKLLTKSSFYKSLLFTLLRALAAFAAAFVAGGALGIAANASGAVEKLLSPLMVLLRAIPTMAVIFLLVLWFRSAYAPMIVAFTILLPLCYAETKTALSSLDGGIFEMCKVYAVPKRRVLARFVLPQIAPPLIDGAAGNLSFSVKLVIAGEALAQTAAGLGGALNMANVYLETARLMAITLSAVVVCFVLEFSIRLLLLPSRRWR